MSENGIQKGESDQRDKKMDAVIASLVLPDPQKAEPKTIEDAIRAGDWIAVARIRAATIAQLERASHEDADGDGRVAGKKVVSNDEAGVRDGNSYLDAEGRDPYGYKYNGNFGYDKDGNYHDSYNGVLNKEGIYQAEDKSTVDLKHGIYASGNEFVNYQTKDSIIERDGKYYHMRKGPNGEMEPTDIDETTGKPKAMTAAERDQMVEQWRRTNKVLTDEQIQKVREEMAETDRKRKAAHDAAKQNNPGGTGRNPQLPQNTSPIGDGGGPPPAPSEPQKIKTESGAILSESREALERAMKNHRQEALAVKQVVSARRIDVFGELSAPVERQSMSQSERMEFMFLKHPLAGRVPNFKLGDASEKKAPNQNKPWIKDKNGGFWDEFGGYYDSRGGYFDRQGGYFGKDGSYFDQYGGYMSKDGSFLDAKGNMVDSSGNFYLSNHKPNDPPDFPARPGVKWVDVLAAANENRFQDLTSLGLTADEAKLFQEKFKEGGNYKKTLQDRLEKAANGPQPEAETVEPPPTTPTIVNVSNIGEPPPPPQLKAKSSAPSPTAATKPEMQSSFVMPAPVQSSAFVTFAEPPPPPPTLTEKSEPGSVKREQPKVQRAGTSP
jgi:hypothetical protein